MFYQIFLLVLLSSLTFPSFGCAKKENKKKGPSTNAVVEIQSGDTADDSADVEQTQSNEPFKPFYVFYDKDVKRNHFIPSGFMPDGKCVSMNDAWVENCYNGKTCVRVDYDVECSLRDQQWAGIYWLNPANNWGQRKGGFNLKGATKLTFWARGEEGGEQVQEFTVGGIMGNYPDSDVAVVGPVILSKEWRQYTVDLRGKDLSYISGGFAWTTNTSVNPQSCVFYLDDIRYE